ncbi:hypothetical protein A8H39_10955 [Paraburkholderia fungorum]|jgi:hypothetical protein|uniref:hypothetical protein n=1 Tax=Paraburkholderia fungorum TaxID=134537 RepID=UPI00048059E4|nr:hypothetical protein [Paraburkholderia fungorum]MBB5543320.1 hypothetical protein [Paraburkholderia fungorum]PNE56320.1 hypothetical protein A8H39_10955 [Paraburkholderia fungorum]
MTDQKMPMATTDEQVECIRQLSQKCFADLADALANEDRCRDAGNAEAELIATVRRIELVEFLFAWVAIFDNLSNEVSPIMTLETRLAILGADPARAKDFMPTATLVQLVEAGVESAPAAERVGPLLQLRVFCGNPDVHYSLQVARASRDELQALLAAESRGSVFVAAPKTLQ